MLHREGKQSVKKKNKKRSKGQDKNWENKVADLKNSSSQIQSFYYPRKKMKRWEIEKDEANVTSNRFIGCKN